MAKRAICEVQPDFTPRFRVFSLHIRDFKKTHLMSFLIPNSTASTVVETLWGNAIIPLNSSPFSPPVHRHTVHS